MSFWDSVSNFFTPKMVNSKSSAINDPYYAAQKVIKTQKPNTTRGAVNLLSSASTYKPKNTTTGATNLIKSAQTYKPRDTTKGATNLIKSVAKSKAPASSSKQATSRASSNNGGGGGYGTVDLNSFGMGDGSQSAQAPQPWSFLGDMSAADFLNMDLSPEDIAALRAQADIQAKSQNDGQRQVLDMAQKQYDSNWTAAQKQLADSLASAQRGLENQSFQDYLQSRQSIADRGLASSGLADDANTRLMLNRNQALADLFTQNDSEKAKGMTDYNNQIADLNGKRSLINDATTSDGIYQQLYQTARDQKEKHNQMMLDLYKWQTPSGDTQFKANTDQTIAQMNIDSKQKIAQLENDTKLTINENNNATDLAKTAQNIQQKMNELNSLNWNRSQNQNIALSKQKYSQAAQILSALSKDPSNKKLQNDYKQAIDSANSSATEVYKNSSSSNANFNSSSGGSGVAGNAAYQQNLQKANSMGLDPSWNNIMSQIVSRESSFNPRAQNPTSTAYGYGQFLNSTRKQYEAKTGLNYNDPASQLVMMGQYIKDRYGSPANALAFWNKNHWY